jgi:hypothetical protein
MEGKDEESNRRQYQEEIDRRIALKSIVNHPIGRQGKPFCPNPSYSTWIRWKYKKEYFFY